MLTCPNCGAIEKARVKICRSCGEAFASEDLLELQLLEFLLEETSGWDVPEKLRYPYQEQLKSLQERLARVTAPLEAAPVQPASEEAPPPVEKIPEVEETPAAEEQLIAEQALPAAAALEAAVTKPKPAREKVPFDQWLLSTRNINIALYTGGLLLILAGLIFIGVNWTRIPGLWKFVITLLVTGLMYLGGHLLYKRPALRIGAIALTAIASGFFLLNFAVLQIYVVGPLGLSREAMWLIASLASFPLYGLITYLTRHMLFTLYTQAAVFSIAASALVLADAPLLVYLLVYGLVFVGFFFGARFAAKSQLADITEKPFLYASNIGLPLAVLGAVWVGFSSLGCVICIAGSPWWALPTMIAGVVYYLLPNPLIDRKRARWAAAPLVALAIAFLLFQLGFDDTAIGIGLMVLCLALLGSGYWLEKQEGDRRGTWPLYLTAYLVAVYITQSALPSVDDLILALFGDVLILGLSTVIFSRIELVYGAVWLLMLPVYLLLDQHIGPLEIQGLLLGGLALVYLGAGYLAGRRKISWAGPCLSAAAFLTLVIVPMTWSDQIMTSITLLVITAAYLLVALWLGWPWLLAPSLVGLCLAVFTSIEGLHAARILLPTAQNRLDALVISYLILGIALLIAGYSLFQKGEKRWALPLQIAGAIILPLVYGSGLLSPHWLAASVSITVGAVCLGCSWLYREEFNRKLAPFLSYLGLLILFGSQYYLLQIIGGSLLANWPAAVIGSSVVYIIAARILDGRSAEAVYGSPLLYTGLISFIVPLAGAVILARPLAGAICFASAGLIYTALGMWDKKRIPFLTYLGLALLYGSQFYLYQYIGGNILEIWPTLAAALSCSYVILAWILDREPWIQVYSTPFRLAGLISILVPLIGAAWMWDPVPGAITYLLAGCLYTGIGFWRKDDLPILTYLGLGLLFGSQVYLYELIGGAIQANWPAVAVLVCAVFVSLGRVMDKEPYIRIFSKPLLYGGLGLLTIPLAGAVFLDQKSLGFLTLLSAGLLLILTGLWRKNALPLFTYLGLSIVFASQYYLYPIAGESVLAYWQVFSGLVCALLCLAAYFLDREPNIKVFSRPLLILGLCFFAVPILGCLMDGKYGLETIVLLLAALSLLGVGLWQKKVYFYYLSVGALAGAISAFFIHLEISEPQAYFIPVSLGLLGIGWSEKFQGHDQIYRVPAYLGLLLLLGSSLVQSLPRGEYIYAVLLGGECIAAVAWGIQQRMRFFVQAGSLILFLNALIQFGPGFVELPRWIQIGITGTILLAAGLAALFKREEILSLRRNISDEMKSWEE